jgi:tetraacyldisaccharide 4'-kinase
VRAALSGQRVVAMAAIAHPDRFSALLRAAGAQVVRESFFHDHHPFPAGALEAALAQKDVDAVAITEKDAVKLATVPAGVIVVKTALTLPDALIGDILKTARIIERA